MCSSQAVASGGLLSHLPVLGEFLAYAVVGVAPELMGIGPALAIPALLRKAAEMGIMCGNREISIDDIDLFEINEAFASQVIYCIRYLGKFH